MEKEDTPNEKEPENSTNEKESEILTNKEPETSKTKVIPNNGQEIRPKRYTRVQYKLFNDEKIKRGRVKSVEKQRKLHTNAQWRQWTTQKKKLTLRKMWRAGITFKASNFMKKRKIPKNYSKRRQQYYWENC